MKDQKNILEAYKKIDFSLHSAALATVVKVHGSSYRSPGARMLITDDGKWTGSISGGCLEGDALRKARQVMLEKRAMTITYDTREESNQNLGIGLGCNGIIDVLIEPIDPKDDRNTVRIFENLLHTEQPVAVGTVISKGSFIADKMIAGNGSVIFPFKNSILSDHVVCDLKKLFITKKSETKHYRIDDEEFEIFLELIPPCYSLIIFGGGFDARPVSELAKSLGWNVSVTDECVAHIAPVFFPAADNLYLCRREFIDRDLKITPYTACVLMSHNYEYDRDVLKKLLSSESHYIGILGPRKRFEKMLLEYKSEGIAVTSEDIRRIHSPIGLDIGAETPDEIAVSIIAEIQSKFSNRSGGFLRYRNSPIHQRDQKGDQVFKEVYISDARNKSANF